MMGKSTPLSKKVLNEWRLKAMEYKEEMKEKDQQMDGLKEEWDGTETKYKRKIGRLTKDMEARTKCKGRNKLRVANMDNYDSVNKPILKNY